MASGGEGYVVAIEAAPTFTIELEPGGRDRPAVLAVSGDLDIATSVKVEECLGDGDALRGTVVIDLSQVTFLDSTGLRALWTLRQRIATVGGQMQLREPSDAVRRVLRTTKLDKVFECVGGDCPD